MSTQNNCRWMWSLVLACAATAATVSGGEVGFSAKPTVSKNGEKAKIAFAVSAPTDVEVAILGADGAVVRHLAAGVLGAKNPPPEPLKEGLTQSLEWDGKDDAGKPVAGGTDGPFKVRVRAGMSVKFGKIIGTSPYTGDVWSGVTGLTVAPDGSLYAKLTSAVGNLHQGMPWQLRRFDRTGKYQKTLLPYPPSTPADKVNGFHLIDAGDGLMTPGQNSGLDAVLFNFGGNIYNRVVDGNAIFIGDKLTFFKLDGSNTVKTVPIRSTPEKLQWSAWLAPQVAVSLDGKYVYYSNVANAPSEANVPPSKHDKKFPQGRVYRQDLSKPGSDPEKFYDLELPDFDKQKYWLPNAWNMRTAAAGIDVDGKGNLFVCDLVNQEVVEVSPEGKKLSVTKVPWPDKVLVGSKTGALYVISCSVSDSHPQYRPNAATLLKVTGRGADAKVAAKLPLKGIPPESAALDDSGANPVLWLGGGKEVVRIEDKGTELVPGSGSLINSDPNAIDFVCYGAVDTESEQLYVTNGTGGIWRFNGATGEGGRAPVGGIDLAVGPKGTFCVWTGWSGVLQRYTRDFKPAPLASTGKDAYGNVTCRSGRGHSVGGLSFDPFGKLFVTNGCNSCLVQVFEADGKPVEYERKAVPGPGGAGTDIKTPVSALITGMVDQSGSIRADSAGNAYVLQIGVPKDHVPPKGFEKDPAYLGASGAIYKFGPKGGEFQKGQPVGALHSYQTLCGPISGGWASLSACCHCTKPRFDVDPYGRLYIPNGWTYKVTLVDNADNQILSFGGYGNWDAQGPGSAEPKPEIPLGWPVFAGASDAYIYVGDALNHRVVRADKKFAAEQTVDVK